VARSTLLDESGIEALAEVGGADIVVGIPSFHTERTVGHVVKAVQYGLAKYYPAMQAVIVVSDGGSKDATRENAARAALYPDFETMLIRQPARPARALVAEYRGPGGKGSALRAVLEASEVLGAKCCVTVDADLRSITPEWLEVLAGPVLLKGYDFVAPQYQRHKYDGTITNMMVYPLTRALYGVRIRQPIGGDFGMSAGVVASALRKDAWATDVARFGIDIWLTTLAVTEGFRVCQGNLGAKVHDPKDPSHLGPMAMQVMGTVFRLMGDHAGAWMQVKGSRPVREFGFRSEVAPLPIEVDPAPMVAAFHAGLAQHGARWSELLSPDAWHGLEGAARLSASDFRIPPPLWARVVYDLAAAHRMLSLKEPAAAPALVESLLPLYLGRVASFILETASLSTAEAELVVEAQAEVFEQAKPQLVERWRALGLPA